MHNNIPPEEERFRQNSINMAKAIHYGVDKLFKKGYKNVDPTMIAMVIVLLQQDKLNTHDLIKGFIKKSHKECWDKIKERDEKFFIINASNIFDFLPSSNISIFKDLYQTVDDNGNNIISQSLKDEIWIIFDALIKVSIKYIYKHKSIEDFKNIDIDYHIQTWNIKI